jgi:hypothetical protein
LNKFIQQYFNCPSLFFEYFRKYLTYVKDLVLFENQHEMGTMKMSKTFTLGEKEAEKCCEYYQNANRTFFRDTLYIRSVSSHGLINTMTTTRCLLGYLKNTNESVVEGGHLPIINTNNNILCKK